MDRLDQLNTLYDHYRTELAKVKKAAGHGGFMGLGMDPRKHPCNQEFYEAVEAWVRQFLAQSPTHEAIFAATEYILHAPVGQEQELTYGYLFAAQVHCCLLIPYLTAEERQTLWTWYDGAFPEQVRLFSGNGEPIAASEVYSSRSLCRKGIESVRLCAALARLADLTEGKALVRHPRFELFQDRRGAFRFRLTARNGKIIAVSDAYSTHAACRKGIESVCQNAPESSVEEA